VAVPLHPIVNICAEVFMFVNSSTTDVLC